MRISEIVGRSLASAEGETKREQVYLLLAAPKATRARRLRSTVEVAEATAKVAPYPNTAFV